MTPALRWALAVVPKAEHSSLLLLLATWKRFCSTPRFLWLRVGGINQDFSYVLVNVVASYSSQLREFALLNGEMTAQSLSLIQYQEVALMSPDLKCTIECNWKEAKDAIAGLGDRLVGLDVFGSIGADVEDMPGAAS